MGLLALQNEKRPQFIDRSSNPGTSTRFPSSSKRPDRRDLVPWLRMSGTVGLPSLLHLPSCRGQRDQNFTFSTKIHYH